MATYRYERLSDGSYGWIKQPVWHPPFRFHIVDSQGVCLPLCPRCEHEFQCQEEQLPCAV